MTGTPVRGDFFTISKQQAKERLGMNDGRKLIVSFWGSLGSNAMNRAMAEFLALESAKEPFLPYPRRRRDLLEADAAVDAR